MNDADSNITSPVAPSFLALRAFTDELLARGRSLSLRAFPELTAPSTSTPASHCAREVAARPRTMARKRQDMGAAVSNSPIFRLSAELRNEIYHYSLLKDGHIDVGGGRWYEPGLLKARRDYLVAVAELNGVVERRTKARKGELAKALLDWVSTPFDLLSVGITQFSFWSSAP